MKDHSPSSPGSLASNVEVVLKQIRLDGLYDLGWLALKTAFVGYTEDVLTPEMAKERLADMKAITSLGDELEFQPEYYRRFAGDESLPRGHYYSLALDDSGEDGGTLVQELQTYYRPRHSGIVQVYDTTLPSDRQLLEQSGVPVDPQPTLQLHFIPTRSRPNPFSRLAGFPPGESIVVALPLTVERRQLNGVVDLRDPSTASSLAHQLTKITWQLNDYEIPAFPSLKEQKSFSAVIPSLLEQNVGGTDFTNVLGLWLRNSGICGLIYPSARVDTYVNVAAGSVTSWSGFNYVHYDGAPRSSTEVFVHIASRLPERVRYCPLGKEPAFELPRVAVHFEHRGNQSGTWRVEGLQAYRVICSLLAAIEYVLEELSNDRSAEIAEVLHEWLIVHLPRNTGEQLARVIFHALMGPSPYKAILSGVIRDMLAQTTDNEEMRFMDALLDIERVSNNIG